MANDEINVPSLVLILVVSGLLLRHFFFRGTPSSSAGGTGVTSRTGALSPQEQRRAEELDRRTEAAVAQIQQIFPNADRREVWWDLRRSNLNVAATTERILAGRLEMPPVTFQPPQPPQAAGTRPNRAGGSRNGSGASGAGRSSQPNLIQRYNLEGRVSVAEASELTPPPSPSSSSASSNKAAKSWSSNRDERQSLLKKRRDDMILEARRKMEAKIAAEKAAAAAASSSA